MILITTPNGKVGTEVAKQLIIKGIEVRIGAHTVEKAQAAFPQAHVVRFDFDDEQSVQAAVEGVDAVYLASPGNMVAAPVNCVVDHARAAGVGRIVRLSAMGIEHTDTSLRQIGSTSKQPISHGRFCVRAGLCRTTAPPTLKAFASTMCFMNRQEMPKPASLTRVILPPLPCKR